MSLIRLNRRPSRNALRVFGFLCLVFLAGFGLVAWRKGGHETAGAAWLAGAAAAACAVLAPGRLRYPYLAATYLSFPIGFVASHLILAAAYYFVLTPIGLLLRWFGHDPLSRRWDRGRKSYWEPRSEAKPDAGYFHQN
jgi:hypothetical protein